MEKAILVYLSTTRGEKYEAEESMEELQGLCHSAGAQVIHQVFQHRSEISPKYLIGKGKVEELVCLVQDLEADLIIFNRDLTPIQQRSLEDDIEEKVIDRTQLILDIFSQRARSKEGKLQVELAQLSYVLPRLSGKGQALSRLGGGIGTRGPGEKKLEEDRRKIKDRIAKINKDIRKIQKRRSDQRKSRKRGPIPSVSLVGYTNAGKSTLFNLLSHEDTHTSSQLFATLDPIHRRVSFSDGLYLFLSDTVGFIKKLPPELIAAFMATLEELKEADAICHVIDVNSSRSEDQAQAVENILFELGVENIPVVKIFNKIDLLPENRDLLAKNKEEQFEMVYVSAKTGSGITDLKDKLHSLLYRNLKLYYLRIPISDKEMIRHFPKWTIVLKKRENGHYYDLKIMAEPKSMVNYLPYITREEENW